MQLYVIKSLNYYKIGICKSIKHRLLGLAVANPFGLEVVYLYDTLKAKHVELTLHRHFGHRRVHGEWFELSLEDIESIPALVTQASRRFPFGDDAYQPLKTLPNPVTKGFKHRLLVTEPSLPA